MTTLHDTTADPLLPADLARAMLCGLDPATLRRAATHAPDALLVVRLRDGNRHLVACADADAFLARLAPSSAVRDVMLASMDRQPEYVRTACRRAGL